MQDSIRTEAPKQDSPARSEVDFAFDEFLRVQHIVPYGRSGLRDTFEAGWLASRGEQPVKPPPPASVRVYPLRKKPEPEVGPNGDFVIGTLK